MKELTTDKPLVIGMIGYPGAGKSRFAREFGAMFGAPVLEANRLRQEIFGAVSDPAQVAAIDRAIAVLASELAKSKRLFIVDGGLNRYSARTDLRAQVKHAGYDTLLIWVQTNEDLAQTRALRPKKDSFSPALTAEEFADAARKLEPPHPREASIVVSGQHTFAAQVRPILKKIAERHTAELKVPTPERPVRRSIFIR